MPPALRRRSPQHRLRYWPVTGTQRDTDAATCQHGRMATYVLWDIDGTLITNDFSGVSIYARAFERTTGTLPSVRVQSPHGMTEGQLLVEMLHSHGFDVSMHEQFMAHLTDLSIEENEEGLTRNRCPGVLEAIHRFGELGWHNGLLTGNAPDRARFKMIQAGIHPDLLDWEHSYFGHRSPTRHDLTASAASALSSNTVVIVGDTPTDGAAAASAGFPFLGVGTGSFTAEQLRSAGAFLAIDSFASGLDDAVSAIRPLEEPTPAG